MLSTFKALADETRLRLLAVLACGEFTVQELTFILAMGQSRVSRHLKILTEAGLSTVKRQGTWAYYRLEKKNGFFSAIRSWFESHLEFIEGVRHDRERLFVVLEQRRSRSKAFFDRHARQWDEVVRHTLPTADYVDALLASIPSATGILEVGVGTGNLLGGLRQRAAKVIGVDHSPVMLEMAGRRVESAGLNGIELRLGDMRHLPVSDGEVQWAVLNMVLHHAAQPQQVFFELARVLEPGGGVSLADLQRHEDEWVRDSMADQWLGFEREELETWLRTAGFGTITSQVLPGTDRAYGVVLLSAMKTP